MPNPPEPILLSNLSVASSISDKANLCAVSVATSLKYDPSFFAGAARTTVSTKWQKLISACSYTVPETCTEPKNTYHVKVFSFSCVYTNSIQ